jgi:hypothetical protein
MSEPQQPSTPPGLYQTPAGAYTRFLELIRKSPAGRLEATPDELMPLLEPFLANPERHWRQVSEIVRVIGYAHVFQTLYKFPAMRRLMAFSARLTQGHKGTMESAAPEFIARLRKLGSELTRELHAGETLVHVRPLRYLDTPAGYAGRPRHKHELAIQIAVEPMESDEPSFLDARLTVEGAPDVDIGEIAPTAAYTSFTMEESVSAEQSRQSTLSGKLASEFELSATLAKTKVQAEAASSDMAAASRSASRKRTYADTEQQVLARRSGRTVFWRIQRSRGPVDVGAVDLKAELLVPENVRTLQVRLDVAVDWEHAGRSPASLTKTLDVPSPPVKSLLTLS